MKISQAAVIGSTLFLASQAHAQMSGVSHPDAVDEGIVVTAPQNSTVTITTPATPIAKPSAAEPYVAQPHAAQPSAAQPEVYEAYRPYQPGGKAIVATPATSIAADPDAGIVTSYEYHPDSVSVGTLVTARLVGTLSTEKTLAGQRFTATLSRPIEHDGHVVVPQGSALEGRVTRVRSGSRISGGASMHLEPETIILPDGTRLHLNARVTDVDSGRGTHVSDEGTIVGGNHVKGHVVTLAATTGGGAITGAVLGGGVGAAVGAGIGAGVGTVLWLKQDREQTLPDGTELVFSLNRPMDLRPFAAAPINR